MEDIVITSNIDFKTYLTIGLRAIYKTRFFIFLLILFAFMESPLVIDSVFDWWNQLFIIGYFIFFFGLLLPGAVYLACKRSMTKTAMLNESVLYTINEDKIELKGESFHNSSNWKYVTGLVEREKYFALYTGGRLFSYLPKDGFYSKEDMLRLKAIVKEKGLKFSYK